MECMPDEYVTVKEASELSGIHPQWIRDLIKDGRIKAEKFGPVWMIDRDAFLDFIASDWRKKRGPR